ncbi:receptor like protein kinase S.2-like [Camellia sinensis]|uniref:receptor like protein kinase S.2-like n=1 Tax=Camellia sinensis TaxID=4442 RepID=UPI0010361821|nr:receptor like protein kinase S.2-like [Camellia sinensis]
MTAVKFPEAVLCSHNNMFSGGIGNAFVGIASKYWQRTLLTSGFGKVYKGFIDGGATTVAIKRSNAESKQGAAEFWTEIKTLSKLRHTHLVTLIGYSDDCEEMILVYEYMVNGTLVDHLYKNSRKGNGNEIYRLTWEDRLKICIGAAEGLDYLHTNTEQAVIHRDVKSTNILLDENWVAKISDFGLSKMVNTSHTRTHVSTDVKGTFGYLDPAYFLTRRLTKKSDVYAFGVVLFEVLCARPPVDTSVEEDQMGLALWAQKCIKKGTLDQIIDPSIRGQISPNCLKVFAEVANKCLLNYPKGRPTMSEVVGSLKHGLASQGNIRISRQKGIISNLFLSTAHVVAKGIDLGWRKWKNNGPKNGMSRQLWKDPIADVIQLYRRFSFAEIRAATNNFHEILGIGLRGDIEVYRGHISRENLDVAIKRWKEGTSRERNLDQFRAEIQVHSYIRHLHVVSLIGYCIDKHEVILVYEYMAHGSLYYHLNETNKYSLNWEKRLEICIGVARGLQYLHAGTRQTIIHRNLNPTNILLDENWNAKVVPKTEPWTSIVGYMDPEYLGNAQFTIKSNVYSFGVILLELLCGRKPMIYSSDEDQVNLVRWFKTNIKMGTIDQIIDPYLTDKIAPECLKEYVKNAENCVCDEGIERPSMDDVLGNLRYALQLQETWRNINEQFGTDTSPEAVPLQDGIVFVELASGRAIDEMSFTSIGDSDCFSGRPTTSEVVGSLEHGLASQDNIRISRRKGIISNLFFSTAYVVAKGIDLGWRKWKNNGPKNGMSWQLRKDPIADAVIQIYRCFSLPEIVSMSLWIRFGGDIKVYGGCISHRNLDVAIKRWKKEHQDKGIWTNLGLRSRCTPISVTSTLFV